MSESISILIVDDNPSMADTLADILGVKGFEVHSAYSGAEALDILRKEFIHLVLTDLKMPKMDGTELLKVANLKRSDVFNILLIQAGVARIEKRVRREGYMRVKTRVDRKVNDPAKTVGLAIHVEDGPRYLLAKLNIEGLDLISEPAIRQIWAIKDGQPFNADYPDYFLNRVREDGVLDDLGETKSKVKTDDTAKTVEVTLIFHGEVKKEPAKQPGEWRP